MSLQSSKQGQHLVALESREPQDVGSLISFASVNKPKIRPPLNNVYKQKRLQWTQGYMKTHFQTVLFMDECHPTLDGPNGWSSGLLMNG